MIRNKQVSQKYLAVKHYFKNIFDQPQRVGSIEMEDAKVEDDQSDFSFKRARKLPGNARVKEQSHQIEEEKSQTKTYESQGDD